MYNKRFPGIFCSAWIAIVRSREDELKVTTAHFQLLKLIEGSRIANEWLSIQMLVNTRSVKFHELYMAITICRFRETFLAKYHAFIDTFTVEKWIKTSSLSHNKSRANLSHLGDVMVVFAAAATITTTTTTVGGSLNETANCTIIPAHCPSPNHRSARWVTRVNRDRHNSCLIFCDSRPPRCVCVCARASLKCADSMANTTSIQAHTNRWHFPVMTSVLISISLSLSWEGIPPFYVLSAH